MKIGIITAALTACHLLLFSWPVLAQDEFGFRTGAEKEHITNAFTLRGSTITAGSILGVFTPGAHFKSASSPTALEKCPSTVGLIRDLASRIIVEV